MNVPSEKVLKERGVSYKLIELSDRALTVPDVIKFSKGDILPEEICKTIIVKDKQDQKHALFLLGSDRIDFKKVRRILGDVRIARPDEVEEVAGVKPGAVCPVLMDIPIYLDKRVLGKEKVNFGSGDHLFGLEIKVNELAAAMKYTVTDIAQT
jgi:prolyl-tRNA editing enzyme YbaK/EbsC (Cys-tRNA(Pro) deacylase)